MYDNLGRVVRIDDYNLDGSCTNEYYLIDYFKNQKIKNYYSEDYKGDDLIFDVLQEKTVYDYDKKNRIIKITESNIIPFYTDLRLYRELTYLYDKFDRLTESTLKYAPYTRWCGMESKGWQIKCTYKYGKKWDKIDKSIINQMLNTELWQESIQFYIVVR